MRNFWMRRLLKTKDVTAKYDYGLGNKMPFGDSWGKLNMDWTSDYIKELLIFLSTIVT